MREESSNVRTCPNCWAEDSRVYDVRLEEATGILKRRRECRACGHRWITVEIFQSDYVKLMDRVGANR